MHKATSVPLQLKGPAEPPPATSFDLRKDWLACNREEILAPDLPIIDPHHHLWDRHWRYLLGDLLADVESGHRVLKTVYVQCNSMYRLDVGAQWASLGETEFVNGVAAMAASGGYGPVEACAGMVAHIDLMLGDGARKVLERHQCAAGPRLKGIRNSSVWDEDARIVTTRRPSPPGLLSAEPFRQGFAHLHSLGLSFDAWLYHPQIPELVDLARAFPDTQIVLDHLGAPLGVHSYANRRAEVFATWRKNIEMLSSCPNVCVKLGGLGMPVMGFGFETGAEPPSSLTLAKAWRDYFDVCIEAFKPERCMFESNFPVDKQSYSYATLWNAFKRYADSFSHDDVAALFHDTAERIYKLGPSPEAGIP